MKITICEQRPAECGVFDHAEGMIRQGDRAQANYRKSETLPIRIPTSPDYTLEEVLALLADALGFLKKRDPDTI